MTFDEGEQLKSELKKSQQTIALLQEQIRLLLQQKFGSKSEKFDSRQLELMMQLAELQQQILKYQGIDLSRQTMSDWMEEVSEWLKPIYTHIGNELRAGPYLQVDETPVKYCGAEGGGSKKGYLWVYNDPRGDILYQWHASRAASCLEPMLKSFSGTIQTDGYSAYPSYAKGHKDLELSACWAHARRKFFDAREEAPQVAGWLLKQIGLLYRIEAQLRASDAGPQLRTAVRQAQSQMIVERIGKALKLKLGQYLPQSGMGKAINYSLGLWKALSLYLDNDLLEIDNNLVENAIRPTALGKKNWLFFGSEDSGQRSAIIYTLLENCKRQGIDPAEYFKDVLTRLPSMKMNEVESLTPANWLIERSAAEQAA